MSLTLTASNSKAIALCGEALVRGSRSASYLESESESEPMIIMGETSHPNGVGLNTGFLNQGLNSVKWVGVKDFSGEGFGGASFKSVAGFEICAMDARMNMDRAAMMARAA